MTRTTTTARIATIAVTTLVGLSGLSACSSSGYQSSSSPSSSAASSPSGGSGTSKAATITIKNYGFSSPASVASGTKITVTNQDSVAHTVTADSGGTFDVKVDPGKSATFKAPASGTYKFHCTYHSSMNGTLKVS